MTSFDLPSKVIVFDPYLMTSKVKKIKTFGLPSLTSDDLLNICMMNIKKSSPYVTNILLFWIIRKYV